MLITTNINSKLIILLTSIEPFESNSTNFSFIVNLIITCKFDTHLGFFGPLARELQTVLCVVVLFLIFSE